MELDQQGERQFVELSSQVRILPEEIESVSEASYTLKQKFCILTGFLGFSLGSWIAILGGLTASGSLVLAGIGMSVCFLAWGWVVYSGDGITHIEVQTTTGETFSESSPESEVNEVLDELDVEVR